MLARDGVLIIRPDSGHPPDVVVRVLQLLGEAFGTETNSKGYRVLNPKVRVIQGDGIDREMLSEILAATQSAGWSTDNVAFGSGGGLLQKLNRDTSKYAFKCASVVVDGVERDVFKQPVTDPGKQSKRGRLGLVRRSGQLVTVPASECSPNEPNELVEVFRDGKLTAETSFEDVRRRAAL